MYEFNSAFFRENYLQRIFYGLLPRINITKMSVREDWLLAYKSTRFSPPGKIISLE